MSSDRPWRIPVRTSWSSRPSRMGVVDVVGDDDRQPEVRGRAPRALGDEPVVVGQEVVRELDVEAARRHRVPASAAAARPRAGPIADPQPPGDLAVAAARERDEPLGVLGEERLVEPRHGLRPREVRPADEPAEAPIAGGVAGEQDEVRPALRVADPAQVLLDRARWPGSRARRGRGRAGRPSTAPAPGSVDGRATPPRRAARRAGIDDAGRVRDGRVEQLDLDADDRADAGRLRGRGEADRAVEALVVGDGERRHPQLGGALDQLVGGRRTVEQREVGVAVELGVGHRDRP